MLEDIQELGETVTRDQILELTKVLGEDLYGLLDHAFESETEEGAKERSAAFVASAKKSPLKVLRARGILNKEQKKLIMDFLGG